MCTAITFKTNDFYFGRTLDIECSYNEEITITPRKYPFKFRHKSVRDNHYAIIGMAYVVDDFPLYYDAVNEKGLAMAGLNFVGNAVYESPMYNIDNVAQFELIPWILSQCASVSEARQKLKNLNITKTPFNDNLPVAELHWLIADENESITVESVSDGIKIYENPVGVLTNNPPFELQMHYLNNYMKLSPKSPSNEFSDKISLTTYSRGMGAIGMPGDLSSSSRFVRAAFTKLNSVSAEDEMSSVSQFFHVLGSVEQVRGCCEVEDKYEITAYTSCINADKGVYYYTTYDNHQINAVYMKKDNLESDKLICYSLENKQKIHKQN